jgi:hypothetical protein
VVEEENLLDLIIILQGVKDLILFFQQLHLTVVEQEAIVMEVLVVVDIKLLLEQEVKEMGTHLLYLRLKVVMEEVEVILVNGLLVVEEDLWELEVILVVGVGVLKEALEDLAVVFQQHS